MLKIITDTSSDITLKEAKEMDITILSLPVTFGETQYHQLEDHDFSRFYALLKSSKELPVSSLSSPGDYLKIFNEIKSNGDSAVVIPVSSQLSGSYQSANIAKEMVDYKEIYILDARQAVIGLRILIEHGVLLRKQGKSAKDIANALMELSGRIHVFGILDTLKYLIKGGRISKSAGLMGSALNIKPIVYLKDGAVSMAGKARGRKDAIKALINHISQNSNFDKDFPFLFGYTRDKDEVTPLFERAKDEFNLQNTRIYPVGGLIGTHVGPKAIVAAWVVKSQAI